MFFGWYSNDTAAFPISPSTKYFRQEPLRYFFRISNRISIYSGTNSGSSIFIGNIYITSFQHCFLGTRVQSNGFAAHSNSFHYSPKRPLVFGQEIRITKSNHHVNSICKFSFCNASRFFLCFVVLIIFLDRSTLFELSNASKVTFSISDDTPDCRATVRQRFEKDGFRSLAF